MLNKIIGLACLFLLVLLSVSVGAQGYSAEMDLNSRYVWHGIALSSGAVVQPSLTTSLADLKVTLWGNYDLNLSSNQFNEVDLYLTYAREWNGLSIEPTLQFYFYPNNGVNNTGELALKLAYPLWILKAYTTQTIDIQRYGGSYFADLGLAYSIENFSAAVYSGWGNHKFNEVNLAFGKSGQAHNLVGADLSLTLYPRKNIYLRPHLNYSRIVDPDFRAMVTSPDILVVGLAVGGEF